MEVYEIQLEQGRHFLHEHFASGSPRMTALREHPRCGVIPGDRGARGQEMRSSNRPTKYLSSAPEVLSVLGSIVTPKSSSVSLFRETLRGIAAQRRREGLPMCQQLRRSQDSGCAVFALESSNTELLPEIERTDVCDEEEDLAVWGSRKYWDAISQEELPGELTRAARQEELDFVQDWHVWDVVPVAESWSVTGKAPLQGKWVGVNKGDLEKPVARSRYVAKEFANTKSNDVFSPTPPLEALRLLLSHAASGRSSSTGGRKILAVDARKAHLHAFAERNLYVVLPPEVRVPGMLRRSLYGTRDALARWEAFLSKQLEGKGFVRGLASACCYRHSSKDLSCVVHGDDFVFSGVESDLE